MIVRDRTKGPVNTLALARMVTRPRPPRILPNIPRPILISAQLRGLQGCGCGPCDGLGQWDLTTQTGAVPGTSSILGSVQAAASLIPGYGQLASSVMAIFQTAISSFEKWLSLGAGRQEADVIVPIQNKLADRLGQITVAITAGSNPSISDLQNFYRELWQLGVAFMEFVLQPVFTDRRASGQALNTIMPYLDGTCGYPVPLGHQIPLAVQKNCLSWGDGTVGGVGTDGMMGAVKRALQAQGGAVPTLPATMISAANTGFNPASISPGGGGVSTSGSSTLVAVGLGLLGLLSYARR